MGAKKGSQLRDTKKEKKPQQETQDDNREKKEKTQEREMWRIRVVTQKKIHNSPSMYAMHTWRQQNKNKYRK